VGESFDELFDRAQDCHAAGRWGDAVNLYRQVLAGQPDDAACLYFCGLVLFQHRNDPSATDLIRRAIALEPDVPEYHCDLGGILFATNDLSGAIATAGRAVELRGDSPEALFILANALCKSGRYDEGIDAYRRVIAIRPEAVDALNNLGMALLQIGLVEEAAGCFARVVELNPTDAAADSNRVYAMHFSPAYGEGEIRKALADWNRRHAGPLRSQIMPHDVERTPGRPLRIGFVSADFREHVVGWNMISWLPHLDRAQFEIYCYSGVRNPDVLTRQLQSASKVWREIGRLSDADAARLIRDDRIDILVDLSLHTSGNRLGVFARKPAPVQISYLGYPGSTGLETMDYRLSDPVLDPIDSPAEYVEQTIHLPQTYWCYKPGGPTPDVVPPPVSSTGRITFGRLNHFQKVSAKTLEVWAKILLAVPSSPLILHAPPGSARGRTLATFELAGVSRNRIEFVDRLPWSQYIRTYARIDVALDPFPYGGGITSCDALWMGVPLVTLRGETPTARAGASISRSLGSEALVAMDVGDYIAIATSLAADIPRLGEIRSTLRQRIVGCPLTDCVQFASEFGQILVACHNRAKQP
jgi:protein O-GlcNAc transferase